ncbi:MAG: response regulator transcription factor [Nakamurella sp.]
MNPTKTPSASVQAAARADPELACAARVCRVVICDDQPQLRDAIRSTLAAAPCFTVIADADDANSCLNIVRDTHPDVLILDVNMPGGGPHVAAAAKNIHPRLHIVVFSGRADSAIAEAMLAAGADQYVLKTGRVQPLLKAMENAYQQSNR